MLGIIRNLVTHLSFIIASNKMNLEEIETNIKWDEYDVGRINIHLPIFGHAVEFEIFSGELQARKISPKMFCTIQDVLNLNVESIGRIKELLWEECNFAFTVADYGCQPKDGESSKDAHFREFEISDAQDTLTKSQVTSVQIHCDSDELDGRYAEIQIDTVTDNLISIIVKNGKVIDFDDDGTYLGSFDADEQKAHKDRMKVCGAL